MAFQIQNKPLFDVIPTGENIMFTVFFANILGYFKVKYIARVYVANTIQDLNSNLIATLKATPNNEGRGMFDLSPILDNFVSPDYEGGKLWHGVGTAYFSSYKSQAYDTINHPIHVIDRYCSNQNAMKYFRVKFDYEFATSALLDAVPQNDIKTSQDYLIYNGILNEEDILKESFSIQGDYGYHLNWNNWILNDTDGKFLTNAPLKQYIREDDFMTLGYFSNLNGDFRVGDAGASLAGVKKILYNFYYNGSLVQSFTRTVTAANGGAYMITGDSNTKLQYFGVGTANLENSGSTLPTNWDHYEVIAYDDTNTVISDTYSFYKQEDDCKGYENIRLTWLNKFGVWDYYNFTKRSVRTFTKEAITFQQHKGTWNKDIFKLHGYKGGNRVFKSKSQEKITINTDFLTDDEALWMEELFISNDVFILNKNSTDYNNQGLVRKYIEPVIIENTDHIRKTKSNDGLIQYTFEITKSKNRKTHRR